MKSAAPSLKIMFVLTAADSTRFARSVLRLLSCHAYMAPLSSLAVSLKLWILSPSLLFHTLRSSTLWKSPMVNAAICITIMHLVTLLVKLVVSVLQVVVKSATAILPSAPFSQFFHPRKTSHTPSVPLPKLCLKTVPPLWLPLVHLVLPLWMPASL